MEVTLLLADLLTVRDVLNSSYHHNVTLDMAEGYRKLNRQNRSSPMTLALKDALDKAEDYIRAAGGGDTDDVLE